ncbi:MAG: hypothetical protein SPG81_05820, partial [Candidatus Egerieousia sp.]|nr:hypothetical protein [Candidatus Egerieousia sp.]
MYTIFGDIQFLLTNFVVAADGCSIGQLPDAANVKAAAANARTLVRRCSAAVPQLAASSRWCPLLLGIGAPPGSFFPMVLCGGPATMRRCICIFATALRPATNLIRCARPVSSSQRPGQQLRHGAPASNKPHLADKSTPVWLAIWRI